MREDLDKQLCEDFPLLYRDRHADSTTTCMCWGFPRDGWEQLIRRLSEKLERAIEALPPEEQGCAFQVKEKFGRLRFYMTSSTAEMNEWIADAEDESSRTCDVCGELGKLVGKGWVKTRCSGHEK